MFRSLLTTTALALFLSGAAIAQETTTPAPDATTPPPATDTTAPPANDTTKPPANDTTTAPPPADTTMPAPTTTPAPAPTTTRAPFTVEQGYAAIDGDNIVSRILGSAVYTSAADDADTIGNINDLVVDGKGDLVAAVIGVGGFLGLGEKNVAVDFSQLQWVAGPNGDMRYVLPTTADALKTAPDFVYDDQTAAQQAANVDNTPVVADPNATTDQPVTDTTMAPANNAMIDRNTLTNVDMGAITTDELKGTHVYGVNDQEIGTIGDFVLSDDGKVEAVIVDVGGFLGIGKKPVAVDFSNLSISQDANNNRYLFLNTTKEQLEAQPEFNRDTFATDRTQQLLVVNP